MAFPRRWKKCRRKTGIQKRAWPTYNISPSLWMIWYICPTFISNSRHVVIFRLSYYDLCWSPSYGDFKDQLFEIEKKTFLEEFVFGWDGQGPIGLIKGFFKPISRYVNHPPNSAWHSWVFWWKYNKVLVSDPAHLDVSENSGTPK